MVIVKDEKKLQEDVQRAGFSTTSLAKSIGCSKAHISAILNQKRNPSAVIAVKICEQINGQFDYYFLIQSVHKQKQNWTEVIK